MRTTFVATVAISVTVLALVAACGDQDITVPKPRPSSISELSGTRWYAACVSNSPLSSWRETLTLSPGRFFLETEEFNDGNCGSLWTRNRLYGNTADVPTETMTELAVDFTVTSAEIADFRPTAAPASRGIWREFTYAGGNKRNGEKSRNVLRSEGERLYLDRDGFRFVSHTSSPREHVIRRDHYWVRLP